MLPRCRKAWTTSLRQTQRSCRHRQRSRRPLPTASVLRPPPRPPRRTWSRPAPRPRHRQLLMGGRSTCCSWRCSCSTSGRPCPGTSGLGPSRPWRGASEPVWPGWPRSRWQLWMHWRRPLLPWMCMQRCQRPWRPPRRPRSQLHWAVLVPLVAATAILEAVAEWQQRLPRKSRPWLRLPQPHARGPARKQRPALVASAAAAARGPRSRPSRLRMSQRRRPRRRQRRLLPRRLRRRLRRRPQRRLRRPPAARQWRP
mmetsp:Transcript_11291/g.35265  ORF Transcript_11291/g.35265 Transcript_11291/m.35265 type:complete len:255 (-) Transcript_11291:51-815(-)